jgi:hypothetical protein
MPKQFKTYTRFDGGLNTKTNARSIQDNELAQANNVIVDELGMVKSAGKAIDNDDNYTDPSLGGAMQAGYGLFQAVMDFKLDGTNTPSVFTFLADPSSSTKIDISEDQAPFSKSGSFDADEIDMNVTSVVAGFTGGQVVYDIADGAVRLSDAAFGATNTTKIYQFVKRKLWLDNDGTQLVVDGSSTQTISEYVSTFSGLYRPFENPFITGATVTGYPTNGGLVMTGDITQSGSNNDTTVDGNPGAGLGSAHEGALDTGGFILINLEDSSEHAISSANSSGVLTLADTVSTSAGNDNYIVAPDPGFGFNIEVTQPGAGTMTAGTFEFAQTFIYDERQESLPSEMKGTITIGADKYLNLRIIATNGYNKRISGGRIYMRDSTTKGEYQLVADIDLSKGCRSSLEGEYTGWTVAFSQSKVLHCSVNISVNNIDTFETLNGYTSSVFTNHIASSTASGYKTSVVTNRRKFIANVKTLDSTGSVVHQPDRLLFSDINKFDTILPTSFIDIGVNDGEEFIKLEAYADRLLAYKNRTLYVINIGGGADTQWFLESSHQNMGVEFHAAVAKTPFGVCWVNKNGLYIYDGSRIQNLQTKIIEDQWSSFVDVDTMIGYEPTHKHLVIIRNAGLAFTDSTCDYNNDPTITMDSTAAIASGMTVSGTGIPAGASVLSVTNSTTFELSVSTTGGSVTNGTLTFNGHAESSDNGDAYIYSFISKSFTFVEDLVASNIKTNPITDVYNKMTMAVSTNEIISYDGEPDSGTTFDIKLKDDDFGLPGVVKKVYGVSVEYASDNDSTNGLKYIHTDSSGVKQAVANGGTLSDTDNDLDVNNVTFSSPLSVSSFQVQLDLDGSSVHKINNVSVEYRPTSKNVT